MTRIPIRSRQIPTRLQSVHSFRFDATHDRQLNVGVVHLKLLITAPSPPRPPELRAALYSRLNSGANFHSWVGRGRSKGLIVTCGTNGVSIDKSPSTDFPYRRPGRRTVQSPAFGRDHAAEHLDPVICQCGCWGQYTTAKGRQALTCRLRYFGFGWTRWMKVAFHFQPVAHHCLGRTGDVRRLLWSKCSTLRPVPGRSTARKRGTNQHP